MTRVPVFILNLFDTGVYTARMLDKKKYEVIGFDSTLEKPGSRSNSLKAVKSPSVSEGVQLAEFLIKYRNEYFNGSMPVLIPASDEFVRFISVNREKLKDHFKFLLPENSILNEILDKEKQLELVKSLGIKVPATYEITDIGSAEKIIPKLSFPVILKPGNAGEWKKFYTVKAIKVNSEKEFTLNVKAIIENGLKVIAQEIIPGDCLNNYEVSSYVSTDGKICGLFTIKKIRQYPMEFGYGCLVETCSNKVVEELTEKFLKELNWKGFANLEFKFDLRTESYYFIEVNPRVWQQIELPYEAGKINYPEIFMKDMAGLPIEDKFIFKIGVKWIDLFSDMLSSISLIKKGKLSIKDWMNSIKNAKKFGLPSIKDPMPVLKDMNYGFKFILAPLKIFKAG